MPELCQRDPRVEDKAFLAFVRRQRCCVCGAPPPVQAAHIRMGSLAYGKRDTGRGERPSDCWTTPLCQSCHLDGPEAQHRVGEKRFWQMHNLNPFAIAIRLYAEFAVGRDFTFPVNKSKPKRKRVQPLKRDVANRGKNKAWPSRPLQSASRWPTKRKMR